MSNKISPISSSERPCYSIPEISESHYTMGLIKHREELWEKILDVPIRSKACFLDVSTKDLQIVGELRVIEQDVIRTRSNEAYFERKSIQYIMKRILIKYCVHYNIKYMQGMNEVLAPLLSFGKVTFSDTAKKLLQYVSLKNELAASSFILKSFSPSISSKFNSSDSDSALNPSVVSTPSMINDVLLAWDTIILNIGEDDCNIFIDKVIEEDFGVTCLFFEKIVDRLAPTVYKWADVQSLQAQLASLHLLLYYFDAELSKYLSKECMSVDIYAQSWLITLFARRLPINLVLYIWDLLIQVDRPCFIIFLAVSFLQHHKDYLLSIPHETLPQTIVRLRFESESEVDVVFQRALLMQNATPSSIINDITKFAFDIHAQEYERASCYYDLMYRPCVVVDAYDIAEIISLNERYLKTVRYYDSFSSEEAKPYSPNRYLLIDCRESNEDQAKLYIQGSLILPIKLLDEITESVRQVSPTETSSLEMLSPEAASILALLWFCRDDDLHFCLFGSGVEEHVTPESPKSHKGSGPTEAEVLEKLIDSQGSSKSIDSLMRVKKHQSKQDSKLPQFRLATALLVLGFSRVSVIRGFSDGFNSQEIHPDADHIVEGISSRLLVRNDGFSSLVYSLLCQFGSRVSNGVVMIPQDIIVCERVRKFYLSENSSIKPRAQNYWGFQELTQPVLYGLSIGGLGDALKKISGFQTKFLENVMQSHLNLNLLSSKISQVYNDSLASLNITSGSHILSESNELKGNWAQLNIRTTEQKYETGSMIVREVNTLNGKMSELLNEVNSLKKKIAVWKRGFDIVAIHSEKAVVSCRKFAKIQVIRNK